MKNVLVLVAGLLMALSIQARDYISASAVTIIVNGNRNLQVSVDGREYDLLPGIAAGNKTTISLTNLETGQHVLDVIRTIQNNRRADRISATFNLRPGFDMLVTINGNGSIELIETKKIGDADNQPPMNNVKYKNLLQSVKNQRTANGRRSLVANAFNNENNYFTTYQAVQLIQLINAENGRLQLAKSAYSRITDRANFDQVYDLLTSQASKNELEEYINSYAEDIDQSTAMTETSFGELLRSVQQQWPATAQMSSLSNAFNNNNNYFTSYQASQLIQITIPEANRLQLAKLSYHTITDRNNFSRVFELLNSTASKNELTNFVNNYSSNSSNLAMSDAQFTALYETIKGQYFPNEKNNSLTNAFNTTSNYFSTAQAKQLIQLVSFESNRLQLAKLSYRTITDRNNFRQLYDILMSQSSRNELDAYVNAYKE